jgi:YVTN family beta-propeller protein
LAPLAVLAGCGRRMGTGFNGYAFVANEEGRTVAAVDLTAFAVARYIRFAASPASLIADPVRPAVYVLTPATGTIHQIGSDTLTVRRRVHVAHSVVAVRLSADGQNLWLLARDPRRLIRVSLATLGITARIPLPAEPVDFGLSPDGEWAAITFGENGIAGIVNLASGACTTVACGKKLSLVTFRSDSRQVLVGDVGDQMLSILEMPGGGLVVRLPLAVLPEHFCFSADGGQMFITGAGMDAVVVVYPYWTEVAETTLAGRDPGAMAEASAPDGDFLFVANPQSGEVTIVDIETRRAIAVVAVGQGPGYITITPDKQYALVLNQVSGDMAVIRIAAIAAKRDKSAPLFTMIPVGSKPVSAAVRGV